MKVLIHAKNQKASSELNVDSNTSSNPNVESQAQILCAELEKSGHTVEWSNQTHPARLLLNKYDVIHILTDTLPLAWKSYLLVLAAKTLNISVVVSSYDFVPQTQKKNLTFKLQSTLFDSFSVPEISEIKYIREFTKSKWILPALPQVTVPQNILKSNDTCIVFHVDQKFDELPDLKWNLSENIYIDGTEVLQNKNRIQARKIWAQFIHRNPLYKNAMLILSKNNLYKILSENKSILIANYLKNSTLAFVKLIELCVKSNSVLVLNESQACGLANLWTSKKNAIILNYDKSFTYELTLSELIIDSKKIQFEKIDPAKYETKINEISRLYFNLSQQKELKLAYANLSDRP